MARKLRFYEDPEKIYSIINRCINAEHLLVPTEEINLIIAETLAHAARLFSVDLFVFQFMSNHFHIIARARHLNLSRFMRLFQSSMSRRVNMHHGRTGPVFGKRYNAHVILDEEALWDKYAYTVLNPCLSDLVLRPEQWPGVSSHHQLMTGRAWPALTAQRRRAKRKRSPDRRSQATITPPHIPLAALPFHEHLDLDARRRALDAFVRSRNAATIEQRRRSKGRVLGAVEVLRKKHTQRPRQPKRTPQPPCHASCPMLRAQFVRARRRVFDAYRHAAARFHGGDKSVVFPLGTFPPGASSPVTQRNAATTAHLAQLARGSPTQAATPHTITPQAQAR